MLDIKKLSFEEKLVFITSISLMLPYYVGATVLILNFIYIVKSQKLDSLIVNSEENKWLMGFILYSFVVSIIFQNYLGLLATFGILVFFVFFIYNTRYLSQKLVESILTTMILISSVWFLNTIFKAAFVFFLSGEGIDGFLKFISFNRADSVFFNPNYYGMVGDFMFLIGLKRYIDNHEKRIKFLYGTYLVIAAMAVYLSGSRGAQIALIFGALALSINLKDYKTTNLLILGITVGLGLVIITGNMANTRLATVTQDYGLRRSIWGSSIRFINKHMLIGAGPLGIQAVYDLIRSREVIHSHNILLDFLVNYGLTGMVLIYPFAQAIIDRINKIKNSEQFGLIFALTVTILIHGIVDVTIFWHQTAFIYFLLVFSAAGSPVAEFSTIKVSELKPVVRASASGNFRNIG
ncbi:O-antigen ligase family protein [Microaceticoccus formicicus]|uniref:O-antigen ligase family protein n=1 Tax=Microaceticoccus formicicus TaxID=3118105 RepID=UPI003CD0414C|nr:O-antigen ligase family protein [Peptoniphilaceae bacterium AMB_02]